jgi:MHS family proline/betaine transporter-like MFS transporter
LLHLPKEQRKTAVLAGIVGNIIEWYDFALYGYFASILAVLFFPSGDRIAALIATYGVFAAGFLMRPLGAAIFGWLGDTIGRSRTMLLSVILMAVPTFAIGLLPTYETVGMAAPLLLIAVRLVQGLSVGGEFSSSVTYLVETAPAGKRGLAGSWANVGSMTGTLLGSGVAAALTTLLDSQDLMAWGWRLPFLFGGITGAIAIFLRRSLPESEQFTEHVRARGQESPLKEALTKNRKEMLQGVALASTYGSLFYLGLVYLPTWISEFTDVPLATALRFNTIATALMLPLIPLAGWISDRYVRRTHLLAGTFLVLGCVVLPLGLWMTAGGSVAAAALSQIACAILLAVPCGVAPAVFVELFPARDRLSGYSVAFNVGLGIVGGTTPAVAMWLIAATGVAIAPAYYALVLSLLAAATLRWIADASREPLR